MIHQPSALRDPTDEERAACEAYREAHKDDAIGQVADTLLYEDEKVKIWQMTLEPGQASDLHHHACDYYIADLEHVIKYILKHVRTHEFVHLLIV